MWTDKLGHSNLITHHSYTVDEVPVQKRAYPIPVHKQQQEDRAWSAETLKSSARCVTCQQLKPQIQKLAGPLHSTPVVEPGSMLGLDLMGPFPKSSSQIEHLLVVVDYCSKWVELFPLRHARTPTIANILIKDIFTRWGTPVYLVSNWGPQFTSQLFHNICKQWGVFQNCTMAYHPQINGWIETLNTW